MFLQDIDRIVEKITRGQVEPVRTRIEIALRHLANHPDFQENTEEARTFFGLAVPILLFNLEQNNFPDVPVEVYCDELMDFLSASVFSHITKQDGLVTVAFKGEAAEMMSEVVEMGSCTKDERMLTFGVLVAKRFEHHLASLYGKTS